MSWWDRQAYKSTALAGSGNQGLVSTGTQTFAGDKTFADDVTVQGNITLDTATFADAVTCQTTLEVLGNSTFDTATFEDTVNFDVASTHDSDIVMTNGSGLIRSDTSDGSDTKWVAMSGAGALSVAQGAAVRAQGNEHASRPGELELYAGNVTGGEIKFFTDNATQRVRIPKDGGAIIVDDATISTPSGGNLLYSSSGALISRNSSGVEWPLNPVWTDWTPTLAASGGSWSATVDMARYMQIGKIVYCTVNLGAGAVSALSTYLTMTLPVTVRNTSNLHYYFTTWGEWDGTTNRGFMVGECREATTTCRLYTPTLGNITAANARILGQFFYEVD